MEEQEKALKKNQRYKLTMVIIFTVFITFMLTTLGIFVFFLNGKQVGKYVLVTSSEKNENISTKLDKYKTIIDKYFLGEVNEEKLEEGAIKGYIEGLDDPYTEYISKDEMKDYLEDTKGNFIGIGIYMVKNKDKNLIQVLATIKGSPAEKQGIQPGDLIKTVDGVEYTADDLNIISKKIKGDEGTKVKLEIIRGTETKEYEFIREKITVNQVEGSVVNDNLGYIKISSFDEETAKQFKEEFEKLQAQNIKGLIIDLRNNGGGIVSEALDIADYIADKDSVLLYEVDKKGKEEIKKSKKDPIVNMPIVVLVNKNTASSSEILSGALKDLGKAKIVGTKTYGKGVIQEILTLPDGDGLKITTEEYQTPSKNKIHKIGIEPDVVVELPDTVKNILNVEPAADTQMQKAIELLQ
ncbi:MAG: S41 family peptidase [Clostridia bacterium]|nr:S41 family peptidase [Clostridia bacterium]